MKLMKQIFCILLAFSMVLGAVGVYAESLKDLIEEAENKPAAFGLWWLSQEWDENQLYAWDAVFDAITDEKNRNPEVQQEIITPVYVAIVSGNVYHISKECGALKNAYIVVEMDESEAAGRGFSVCRRCTNE